MNRPLASYLFYSSALKQHLLVRKALRRAPYSLLSSLDYELDNTLVTQTPPWVAAARAVSRTSITSATPMLEREVGQYYSYTYCSAFLNCLGSSL